MVNILGGAESTSHQPLISLANSAFDRNMDAHLHLYGKDAKPKRKIGHVTLTTLVSPNDEHISDLAQRFILAAAQIRSAPAACTTPPHPNPCNTTSPPVPPLVIVTMGSDSDMPTLKPGLDMLARFAVPFEVRITSAHRTPHLMTQLAHDAAARGVQVIIAAAGGAAHLPGMLASETCLPVIGVPVKASQLDGLDSLLSIVQMPVRTWSLLMQKKSKKQNKNPNSLVLTTTRREESHVRQSASTTRQTRRYLPFASSVRMTLCTAARWRRTCVIYRPKSRPRPRSSQRLGTQSIWPQSCKSE